MCRSISNKFTGININQANSFVGQAKSTGFVLSRISEYVTLLIK